MRRTKKLSILFMALLSIFALVLTGCGGGGGGGTGGTGGGDGTGGTSIQTSAQASEATATGVQAAMNSSGSAQLIQNLGQNLSGLVGAAPQFKVPQVFKQNKGMEKAIKLTGKFSKMKALKAPFLAIKKAKEMRTTYTISNTVSCQDGGYFTYSGSYDDQGNFNFSFTFNNCREDETQLNGPMQMQGKVLSDTQLEFTMTLGTTTEAFQILEFEGATLVSKMEFKEVTLTETLSGNESQFTISAKINGEISMYDYIAQEEYKLAFANLREDISYRSNEGRLTITTNGDFKAEWTEDNVRNSVDLTYTNFVLDSTETNSYVDTTISGKIAIDFTPDTCFEGTFIFETVIPIRVDFQTGYVTQGHIKINGNVHVEWQPDGNIIVWIDKDGDNTRDNDEIAYEGPEYDLLEECDFGTFNEESPESEGNEEGSATGNTMTITLTWTGGETSDMDLHLNYYNTTEPTATTQLKWYVDYHGMFGCSNGYSGADFDNDTHCEVYLDYDDTEGYGPEHITATQLPSGYYVVSVNSYDLDRDSYADIQVTIQIGNTIFGPYTHRFTTDDSEGHDPNAWFAVADIVVDSNGNATVKEHDPTLPLWHDGPYGLSAPKKTKRLR